MFVQNSETIRYDGEHDILYIFIDSPKFAYDDEISPGVFLRIEDDSEQVIGAVIIGYKRFTVSFLTKLIPFDVDFDYINSNYVH